MMRDFTVLALNLLILNLPFFIEDDMKNLAWRIEININDDDINSWRLETDPHEMCFIASAAKRSRAEVKLVSLDQKERAEFQEAKKSEIMNWLRTDTVCKMLRSQLNLLKRYFAVVGCSHGSRLRKRTETNFIQKTVKQKPD